jgi:hypothetical protein
MFHICVKTNPELEDFSRFCKLQSLRCKLCIFQFQIDLTVDIGMIRCASRPVYKIQVTRSVLSALAHLQKTRFVTSFSPFLDCHGV